MPTEPPFNICDVTLCEFGRCVLVDGNATCQCNKACPLIYAPVCGSDNETYPNLCVMDSQGCEKGEHIKVQHIGNCGEYSEVFLIIEYHRVSYCTIPYTPQCTILHHTLLIIPFHTTPYQNIPMPFCTLPPHTTPHLTIF